LATNETSHAAASVRVEGAAATARILSRGFRRSNAALASEVDGLEEEEDEDAASREGAIVVVIVGGGEGAVVDSSAATPTAAPVVDVVVASASATTYVADATFPMSHALAGPGSPEVPSKGGGLLLPDPLRGMLCFFLFRAATSHAFAGDGSPALMMVASASIAGIVWLWMK
jgi:hypothetical protein